MTVQMDAYSSMLCRARSAPNNNTKKMARIISRASAGCIAALDQLNPRKILPGAEPWLGVELKVKLKRLICMETYLLVKVYHACDGR